MHNNYEDNDSNQTQRESNESSGHAVDKTDEYIMRVPTYQISSTYRGDYQGIKSKRPDIIKFQSDYDDVIAGPYFDPLLPDSLIAKQSDGNKWETPGDFYKKITDEYPNLKKHALPEDIQYSTVADEYTKENLTVYQVDYYHPGDIELTKHKKEPEEKKRSLIGEDSKRPETTQRMGYRNLARFLTFKPKPPAIHPPSQSQLALTRKQQEILKIKTGKTEYEQNISDMGGEVCEYSFFGEIKPLPREITKYK